MPLGCAVVLLVLFIALLPHLGVLLLFGAGLYFFSRLLMPRPAGLRRRIIFTRRPDGSYQRYENVDAERTFDEGQWQDVEDLIGEFFRVFQEQQRRQGGFPGAGGSFQGGGYRVPGGAAPRSEAELLKLFDLPPNADAEAIKSAYRKKVLQYHPDRLRHLGADEQAKAAERFKELQSAYDELRRRRGL